MKISTISLYYDCFGGAMGVYATAVNIRFGMYVFTKKKCITIIYVILACIVVLCV